MTRVTWRAFVWPYFGLALGALNLALAWGNRQGLVETVVPWEISALVGGLGLASVALDLWRRRRDRRRARAARDGGP